MSVESIAYKVEGMTCGGCSSRLKKLLEKHDSISSAEVSHEEGISKINGNPSDQIVRQIVENAGFKFLGKI